MNWFVDTVAPTLSIRDTTQTSTGQKSDATWDDTRLVADDISKQIARNHHTVESSWVLDHQHGRAVNQMMSKLQLRKFIRHDFCNDLPPQPTRRQHVCLVQTPHRKGRVLLERQMRSQPRNSLDLCPRVWLRVPRCSIPVVLLPLAKVDAPSQLADDVEVRAAADFRLERGDVNEGLGGEVAGS